MHGCQGSPMCPGGKSQDVAGSGRTSSLSDPSSALCRNENLKEATNLRWRRLGLAKLADCLLLGWADQEQVEESADLEQTHDLARDPAKGELALPLLGSPVSKDQGAQTGAADIRDVLEIDDDPATARLDQGHQLIAELFRSRVVDSAMSLENRDIARHFLDQLHDDSPPVDPGPRVNGMSGRV